MNTKIKWIIETAIFLAILIVLQVVTKPLGTLVTGSAVNFVLIASVLMLGIYSGLTIAIISPVVAMMLGVAALPIHIVPVVAFGNAVLVLAYFLIKHYYKFNKDSIMSIGFWLIAIPIASLLKFFTLFAGVNYIAVPIMTSVSGSPAAAPAAIFSTSQIITAIVGGVIASIIVPMLKKALKK